MRKFLTLIMVLVFLMGMSAGCRREQVQPVEERAEKISLYYGDANNEEMVAEEREIRYREFDDRYKIALEELIQGPESPNLTANISRETRVFGTILQRRDLIVNFSREFARFPGSLAEIIGVGSVVNTLTQFEEIERVKILVEGEELITPGDFPYGFLEPYPLDPAETTEMEVLLYFGNPGATALVKETRLIQVPVFASQPDIARLVVEELLQGPKTQGSVRTLPQEAVVLSTSIQRGICHVDFSSEMHTRHPGGATGESFTINSLVYTLTELDFVEKVKITVEELPLSIEHIKLDQPVGREDVSLS